MFGKRILVRDTTGYTTEGIYKEDRQLGGLDYLVLVSSRQLNYINTTANPPTSEGWKIPGENLIARHLVVAYHESFLDGR